MAGWWCLLRCCIAHSTYYVQFKCNQQYNTTGEIRLSEAALLVLESYKHISAGSRISKEKALSLSDVFNTSTNVNMNDVVDLVVARTTDSPPKSDLESQRKFDRCIARIVELAMDGDVSFRDNLKNSEMVVLKNKVNRAYQMLDQHI